MQVSHELAVHGFRIVETARKYNSSKVRFNLAAIRNSKEIRNRATVTTSEIITVIGIGQSPFHLPKV